MLLSLYSCELVFRQYLFQLRQEFGYDVSPAIPQFAERYAAKEKEFTKRAKEEKKLDRAARKQAYEEMNKDETAPTTEKES